MVFISLSFGVYEKVLAQRLQKRKRERESQKTVWLVRVDRSEVFLQTNIFLFGNGAREFQTRVPWRVPRSLKRMTFGYARSSEGIPLHSRRYPHSILPKKNFLSYTTNVRRTYHRRRRTPCDSSFPTDSLSPHTICIPGNFIREKASGCITSYLRSVRSVCPKYIFFFARKKN